MKLNSYAYFQSLDDDPSTMQHIVMLTLVVLFVCITSNQPDG